MNIIKIINNRLVEPVNEIEFFYDFENIPMIHSTPMGLLITLLISEDADVNMQAA